MASSSSSPYRQLSVSTAANPAAWPPHNVDMPYDWDTPTHDFYKANEEGTDPPSHRFATARLRLDYSYHHKLIVNRQFLQDAILERVVAAVPPSPSSDHHRRPWICFTAGPMGVGKGYVLTQLFQHGYFALDRFLKIDPDMLKQELPEMAGFLAADRASAATKLHRESTLMSDVLLEYALSSQQHVLVDGSLRDVAFYTSLFRRIRTEVPAYRIALMHVTADPAVIVRRAASRARRTGRTVPTALLQDSMQQVPASVAALRHLCHAVHVIANNEGQPLELVESVVVGNTTITTPIETNGKDATKTPPTWDDFQRSWGDPITEETTETTATTTTATTTNHELLLPTVNMEEAFYCEASQAVASELWKAAYPNFCARCALSCDGQCGVCRHGRHLCACQACNPCGATNCA